MSSLFKRNGICTGTENATVRRPNGTLRSPKQFFEWWCNMPEPFLTIRQLAEQLRAPNERLETVIRRIRQYKQANLIPYHQTVKGGVIRFRLSEVTEALEKQVDRSHVVDYTLRQSQRL